MGSGDAFRRHDGELRAARAARRCALPRPAAVRPEWRGRGLARRLIAHVEAEVAARELARVTLNVRIALPGNRELFAACGFREVERRSHPGFAEPTYVVMEAGLRLNQARKLPVAYPSFHQLAVTAEGTKES